jgi:hypothetical protein
MFVCMYACMYVCMYVCTYIIVRIAVPLDLDVEILRSYACKGACMLVRFLCACVYKADYV